MVYGVKCEKISCMMKRFHIPALGSINSSASLALFLFFSEAGSCSFASAFFFQESRIDELACLLDRVNRMEFSFEIGINSLNYLK